MSAGERRYAARKSFVDKGACVSGHATDMQGATVCIAAACPNQKVTQKSLHLKRLRTACLCNRRGIRNMNAPPTKRTRRTCTADEVQAHAAASSPPPSEPDLSRIRPEEIAEEVSITWAAAFDRSAVRYVRETLGTSSRRRGRPGGWGPRNLIVGWANLKKTTRRTAARRFERRVFWYSIASDPYPRAALPAEAVDAATVAPRRPGRVTGRCFLLAREAADPISVVMRAAQSGAQRGARGGTILSRGVWVHPEGRLAAGRKLPKRKRL
jgi:hypothetical protein